jgi:hypothetical protein
MTYREACVAYFIALVWIQSTLTSPGQWDMQWYYTFSAREKHVDGSFEKFGRKFQLVLVATCQNGGGAPVFFRLI